MPVKCVNAERVLLAELSGELDHHAAKQMMQELDRKMEAELPRKLTLDMRGVTFMDSSGIAVLLRVWRRMSQLEGSLTVINVPSQAEKVLRAAGLHRLINIQ